MNLSRVYSCFLGVLVLTSFSISSASADFFAGAEGVPLPAGSTVISGETSEAEWLHSVTLDQYSEWKTFLATGGVLCPIPIREELKLVKFYANSTAASADKLNGLVADLSGLLRPDGQKPASCVQSAICVCEILTVIFPGGTCEIKSGVDSKGKSHAYNEAKIPGISGKVIIDALNSIAYSTEH